MTISWQREPPAVIFTGMNGGRLERTAVLVPPVITPSEVPAGAFMLASGLMARGVEAPIHDLSLGFFLWLFKNKAPKMGVANCLPSLDYLTGPPGGMYAPHRHRSSCGVLQSVIKAYSAGFPGWKLSLMDSAPPGVIHSATDLLNAAEHGRTPFSEYMSLWASHHGDTFDRALVSISYLSQLPAAVELSAMLEGMGKRVTAGGSLPAALESTGSGIGHLRTCFSELLTDDGRSLTGESEPFMNRLKWPLFALGTDYLSPEPVVPFALTTGCVWNRCLFCPDRDKPFRMIPPGTLETLLRGSGTRCIVHLIDSAIPREPLEAVLPVLKDMSSGFYGFARPEGALLKNGFIEKLGEAGCMMLQTGVESGSRRMLKRYSKGFLPYTAERVLEAVHDNGILNYAYLLFGLPEETPGDRDMTLELVRRHGDEIDFLNISIFNLPEKSELTRRAEEFGMVPGTYDPSADVMRFYRPFSARDGSDPRKEAREYLAGVFRKDPAVERILQRTPKWFRAGHMAFMKPSG